MKITADFTRLHSGENLSRKIKFTVDEQFLGKKAKIGFITPRGRIYFTGELSYKDGEGEYIIPAFLADGRGVLHCQLFVWDSSEFLGKSPITEIPVYPSVDDIDCPAISEETKKSLALIFEYLEKKSDKGHLHDDRYHTKEYLDGILDSKSGQDHHHDGRYYTEEEINSLLGEKLDRAAAGEFCFSTVRLPSFEDIDNQWFEEKIKTCADSWLQASADGKVIYGTLSTSDTDYMATRVNPMLYATRENKQFTDTYRDIWGEAKAGGTKTVNCITLCNMLVMGVPYEYSRFRGHENVIGASGYAFDVTKLLDGESDDRNIGFNQHKKLDITTFERILTQVSFFDTYGKLGLTRTLKSAKAAADGDIWYDEIRAGDVLWSGTHSLFCLSATVSGDDVTLDCVEATSAASSSDIRHISITATAESTSYKMAQVARPYYRHYPPVYETVSDLGDIALTDIRRTRGPYSGIPKNADLNTYLTVGEYRCISDTNISSMKNKPDGMGNGDYFRMTVENLTQSNATLASANAFLQTIITARGEIYIRAISTLYNESVENATFYPWKKVDGADVRQSIPEGADLNSFTTCGVYICGTSAKVSTLNNRPSGIKTAFRLIVENTTTDRITLAASTYFTQRIREISGQEYWRRIFYESGAPSFGPWKHVVVEDAETVTT